ncbi:hypothetical protein BS47DRAFT_423037 [Hydnum rufescens UP504]|uniref:Uncharacterized protein n=1 Tax=Hydnum rufescens UP504 TaxID=1448309 RepID=A0A9P6B5M4_9AGAM|nr:hypothetical protein BS47DRAFT_423037 [Hydnum rufescens UP504]
MSLLFRQTPPVRQGTGGPPRKFRNPRTVFHSGEDKSASLTRFLSFVSPTCSVMSVERSQSRGREPLTSIGRGGAGNIRRSDSLSREPVGDERGRELSPAHPDRVTHSGRGGAGNVRSRSRDPAALAKELEHDREVLEARGRDPHVSTGRGGLGNIRTSGSQDRGSQDRGSRSRSRDPASQSNFTSSLRSAFGHHENQTGSLEILREDGRQPPEHAPDADVIRP